MSPDPSPDVNPAASPAASPDAGIVTGMAGGRLRDHAPLIEAVRRALAEDAAERKADEREAAAVLDFASIFLARAPDSLFRGRSTGDLAACTLGAFRFLAGSRPDRVDVAVSNPERATEGWSAPVTVVRAHVSERPFIVDTIREYLHGQGLSIQHMVYPLLDVERDGEGRVVGVQPASDTGQKESLVHCEVERVTDPAVLARLPEELERRLQDVVRATDDFSAMLGALDGVLEELGSPAPGNGQQEPELAEMRAFLEWLRDGAFVFLGYRAYDALVDDAGGASLVVVPGSGLGILRNEGRSRFARPVPLAELPPAIRALVRGGPMLVISKSGAESTVHRRARMDAIGVRRLDARGRTVGEHRFLGLFTSKAYAEAAENIPILRRKLTRVLELARVRKGSHDYKAIITIFNSLPREELFVSSPEEIVADVRTVLTSFGTDDVRVSVRDDTLARGLSVMVIIPRDRFSGDVRKSIEAALVTALSGDVLNYHLALGEGDQARLHFFISARAGERPAAEISALEHTVRRIIRTWADLVEEELERVRPEAAQALARRYVNAFDPEYRAATVPSTAVADILELEAMAASGRRTSVSLANRPADVHVAGVTGATELKISLRGERLILSDFMPILEHLGLTVIAMNPFEVRAEGDAAAMIYIFAVQDAARRPLDIHARGDLVCETVLAARAGDVMSDRLNALVLTAGLHWREVDVLRALVGYAFQRGVVPSRLALPAALVKHPGIAKELFELFKVKFDPATGATRAERMAAAEDIRTAFRASLESVTLLSDDRALRRLEELIGELVRTNFYRRGGRTPTLRSGGVPFVSFKFLVGHLEHSRPTELLFEVWVHSARMEGVHLRGARVSRGGIRWSDRPDDFRKEVLGLVRTQMVKNAVIVPEGSKGGFITRRVAADPEERLAEAKEQYKTLIRGMLDLTDDLADGSPVPPQDVVAYDPPDPYLVVAADKGTATFSDMANGVAAEYGFWLGDAFASGGSHGYDHKAVAITARGGWECVKRHFHEMGMDIQTEPFTVVGIGDMSGDVFGNGMLLSDQIRLIAAFDHRHVFIDPDPDPRLSFVERRRLFALGGSSWADYRAEALSAGAMIVPRGAKEVRLTPEARRALGIEDPSTADEKTGAAGAGSEVLDGEALVRCVLRAPADLLWNGGIGTYVKASTEAHVDAADPTNDAVRVDASALRFRVVGEGGNLGFTQRARVEYALRGGRINTDALDNSGGVDMSDHEVNLKILLAPAVRSGAMTVAKRNQLLGGLTGAVVELVLHDNRSQSLAVSLDLQRARESANDFRDLMFALEKAGDIDRGAEGLPSRDVLAERARAGQSLVRPELCVLLAHAKLGLKTELLKSTLPDDPVAESYLVGYFPPAAILAAGRESLDGHRLRREIIASQVTNDLVDLMGSTFVHRLSWDTDASAEQVVRAWLVASRLADHRALLAQMLDQRSADAAAVTRWLLGLARVLERTARWVLANVPPETALASVVDEHLDGLAVLRDAFGDAVAGDERTIFEKRVAEIRQLGADESFSKRLITLRFLDQLLEILQVARRTGVDPVEVARAYYHASELLHLPWLRRRALAAGRHGQWDHRAAQILSGDVSRAHREITAHMLRTTARSSGTEAPSVRSFQEMVEELRREEQSLGLGAITVAVRELTELADGLAGTSPGGRR
ncbi:MAG: NAD-glutamate dehydrogenase [Gemmatimonadales bacterium]